MDFVKHLNLRYGDIYHLKFELFVFFSLVHADHTLSDFIFHTRIACCFSTSKKGDRDVVLLNFGRRIHVLRARDLLGHAHLLLGRGVKHGC